MGRLKNPCCNGNQADRHHRRRSAQSCARRLSPLPPIRSTHVAPARSASCARCTAASGSGDGPSYRFERCRDDQLLAASSKWHRHLRAQRAGDARLWEIAVLFHLRDAFRSGDVWLTRSRRYGDLKHALVPARSIAEGGRLAVPLRREWLADRQARLDMRLRELGRAARAGTIPGGSIENGVLHIEKLEAAAPTGAEDLVLDLYKQDPTPRASPISCWRWMRRPLRRSVHPSAHRSTLR
ncbi:hypothetical protein ACLB1Q_33920 [Escherichia coli]